MNTQQAPRIPDIQFRVLIIGRANAGKTSILQRICDTTDSPIIYRGRGWARKKVTLDPSMDRGEHSIDDELIFSNHEGYIFHDSRGIESGSVDELQILQQFIRRKCRETRLRDRLHAIWYCVPMDNQRPELDLRFFNDICPDRNVPVIVVFTKYDQFRRNVQMYMEDNGSPDDNVLEVEEKQFQEHYLGPLGEDITYVRLEKMHMREMRCDKLIETTAAALNDAIVGLMLFAVQMGNLKLSVKTALKRVGPSTRGEDIVRGCLIPFPYIWYFRRSFFLKRRLSRRRLKLFLVFLFFLFLLLVGLMLVFGFFFRGGLRLGLFLLLFFGLFGGLLLGLLSSFFKFRGEMFDFEFFGGSLFLGMFFFLGFTSRTSRLGNPFVNHIMSLPAIQNLTRTSLHDYHLIFAIILILKRATFLRLSDMSPQSALTHADVDYREANIDSRIQQYLTEPSQEHSDELFADFIMAVDMTCTHIGVSEDGGR